MASVRMAVWVPEDLVARVEQITERERRGSRSNTIVALLGEAVERRDEIAGGKVKP
jgi:metal-responsive CopG/Arc/MetJ family transcriptional regulator